jgi:flagellar FliJ protein
LKRNISRLQGIARIRKSIEDQCHVELSIIREKQYIEKGKLYHLREAQRSNQREFQENQGKFRNTALYLSQLEILSQKSLYQRRLLQELEKEAMKAKEELLEASKSRKTVEKLLDRERQQQMQSILKQEGKFLDDIAAFRSITNRQYSH